MTASPPLVSCVLITRDRLVPFKESVRCYCEQSYPRRELVVATDGSPRHQQALERFTCSLARPDIRTLRLEPGALSEPDAVQSVLDDARGDIVCHWADADRSAPQRLQAQVHHLLAANAGACLLSDQVHFFSESRDVLWVRARTDAGEPSAFADTVLARRRDCRPAPPSDDRLGGPIATRPGTSIVWMDHAGPLVARVFDRDAPDLSAWREFSEVNAFDDAFVDAHLGAVRSVLLAHRLPRPFLVAARARPAEPACLNWRSP
jgi:hypothetical protein